MPRIVWVSGITTAPRPQPTLMESIDSLTLAGWTDPIIFADANGKHGSLAGCDGFDVRLRLEKYGVCKNWYDGLSELVETAKWANADRILICQDDVVYAKNTRRFVESFLTTTTPDIMSLYRSSAYPRNPGCISWCSWMCSHQITGILAMVFTVDIAKELIRGMSSVIAEQQQLDHHVSQWMAKNGLRVWLPWPSLAQHIGDTSVVYPGRRNTAHRRADCFWDGDAMELMGR